MTWNPYQMAQITVEDLNGNILASTSNTIPVSDEINCGKCHGSNPFDDILQKHDQSRGTNLQNNTPVLCASCHPDPALNAPGTAGSCTFRRPSTGIMSRRERPVTTVIRAPPQNVTAAQTHRRRRQLHHLPRRPCDRRIHHRGRKGALGV
ncbi:MAG: hypothetical protein MZV64_71755 [Ignavibacteriales bacterium]|nr:hypothetical protein [Ignavibacteriales bacterium]